MASSLKNVVGAIAVANKRNLAKVEKEKDKPKKKKKTGKPNWDEMELFSGQSKEPSLADVVGEVAQLVMEKIYGGGRNFPPPPIKEGGRSQPSAPTAKGTPPKKGVSEARKQRKIRTN